MLRQKEEEKRQLHCKNSRKTGLENRIQRKNFSFAARFYRNRSIRLGMRKSHIYITNQPRKIPICLSRRNIFLSLNHYHCHTHLHHHLPGAPYHQRNHHYRIEHRKKTLLYCITGGCTTLGLQTLSLENNCAWAKLDTCTSLAHKIPTAPRARGLVKWLRGLWLHMGTGIPRKR